VTKHRVLVGSLCPDWVNETSTWLQGIDAEFGLAPDDHYRIELCAEELATNVVKYGGANCADQRVELHALIDEERIRLAQVDPCAAFDPRSVAPPPVAHGVAELQVGGQGIHLLRSFSDAFTYTRCDDRNRVELVFNLTRSLDLGRAGAQLPRGVERRRPSAAQALPPDTAPGR